MRIIGSVKQIETEAEARALIAADEPFVWRGGGARWPACQRWSPDYIRSRIAGDKDMEVDIHPDVYPTVATRQTQMKLTGLLDLLTSDHPDRSRIVLAGSQLKLLDLTGRKDPCLGALLDDIERPAFIDPDRIASISFWMSAASYINPVHFDSNGCANFNVQVTGKKRFVLYAPEQAASFHLTSGIAQPDPLLEGGVMLVCDPRRPSCAEHPRYHECAGIEAVIESGDGIYIPPFWFHLVFHLGEFNVNVNYWWHAEHLRLSPVTARWALLDALGRVLSAKNPAGGVQGAAEAVKALPAETRELLEAIERAMLEDPELLHSRGWIDRRIRPPAGG